jgi:hypothetical protein
MVDQSRRRAPTAKRHAQGIADQRCLHAIRQRPPRHAPCIQVDDHHLAWFSRARRLSKDYERDPNSSKAQVYIGSIRLLLRDLCDNQIAYAT